MNPDQYTSKKDDEGNKYYINIEKGNKRQCIYMIIWVELLLLVAGKKEASVKKREREKKETVLCPQKKKRESGEKKGGHYKRQQTSKFTSFVYNVLYP